MIIRWKFCGSWVMRSLISGLTGRFNIFRIDKTWIGLVLTSFGAAMREPVTMISCRGSADTVGACCANMDMLGAAIATARTSRLLKADVN